MDYKQNRDEYMKKYSKYLSYLVLNETLRARVRQSYPKLWETFDNTEPSDEAIKSYILGVLTETRESCADVIGYLRESNSLVNARLAEGLKIFNTSPGRQTFGEDIHISVKMVSRGMDPNTRNHSMTKNPRGKAIIINVVRDEVKREAERFFFIFEAFMFNPVKRQIKYTIKQIKKLLTVIAKEMNSRQKAGQPDEALIVMIITHGQNEMIQGAHYNDGSDPKDICHISEIVDIFAKFKNTIKMFFFTCCRIIGSGDVRYPSQMNCAKANGTDANTNTLIFYSSAEGYITPHNGLYTDYGRVLSESFAQYAHNECIDEIINRTNHELERLCNVQGMPHFGYYAPEYRGKCNTKKVYFNPGWYRDD